MSEEIKTTEEPVKKLNEDDGARPGEVYVGEDYNLHNHDERKVISTEKGDESKGEPPIKAFTEEVTPNKYHVEINPEDWEDDASTVKIDVEVIGLHESCICHIYPDEDLIMNKCSDRKVAQKLLEDIYDGVFTAKTQMHKLCCRFLGSRPKETIYLDIEELPFFDVPGSRFGL